MLSFARAQRISLVTVALAAVTFLGACDGTPSAAPTPYDQAPTEPSAPPEPEVPAEPDPRQRQQAKVAWSQAIDVIGQPVDAGASVLVLARRPGDELELVSLDKRSGSRRFSMRFDPGGTPTGVKLTPKVTRTDSGRYLAVLRRDPIGSPGPALVAVDARSGRLVRSTPNALDDYEACSDGHDVCWSGYPSSQDDDGVISLGGGPMRWDLETGRLIENEASVAARKIGDDLYVRGYGSTSSVTRLKGSRGVAWSQPTSLAVGRGADSDYGWTFEHDTEEDVYVGALGRPFAPSLIRAFRRGERVEFTYESHYRTVAIDGRDGTRLWARRGANAWCPLLRPMEDIAARTLCVLSGSSVQKEGREPRDKDLTVTLEGVDPRTGESAWAFELSGADAVSAYTDRVAPLAPYGVVLPSADGAVALDMRTGERQVVEDDTVLLCPAGPERITTYGLERTAEDLYRSCDPSGRTVKGVPSAFGVAGVDGTGDLRFVSMPGRVVAFRLT